MNKFSLDKHPKIESGFKAPENYFDNFPDLIMEKIAEEKPKKGKLFSLTTFMYAAAAVIVIALSIPFLTSNSITTIEQIDTASLENYISYQSYGSQYEVMNLIDSEDLDDMQVDLDFEDQSIENILTSNPSFENYIAE
ncbi:hypothetical protein [Flavobacterium tegetincola]|uniref:hypothetical protein n=1 Tax=Flavobacterium tegetincola TaxID=150172 RepID=UPI00040BEFE5|nr:hypothetical protein [Flavobacterium tegetincola]